MTDFAQYDGYKHDFDFHVGTARAEDFHSKAFGDRLWADLSRILEKPFEGATIEPDAPDGHRYWFGDDDLSAHLHSAPPEPDSGVLGQVPAMLTVISRSYEVASSELAERMYDGLTASDDYLVVVFAYDGMPIAADFDIGDDW